MRSAIVGPLTAGQQAEAIALLAEEDPVGSADYLVDVHVGLASTFGGSASSMALAYEAVWIRAGVLRGAWWL